MGGGGGADNVQAASNSCQQRDKRRLTSPDCPHDERYRIKRMCVTRVCKRGSWQGVQVVMMFVVEDDDDDGLTHQVEYFKDRVKKAFPQPISSFR